MNVPFFESFGILLAGIFLAWLYRFLAGRGIRLGFPIAFGILLVLALGTFLVGMVLWLLVISFV